VIINPSVRRRAAVLAVLRVARDRGYLITRVKLAKLLYLADLRAVAAGGDPLSGIEWKWLNHGPFNNILLDIERDLDRDGFISTEQTFHPFGRRVCLTLVSDEGPRLPDDEERVVADTVAELGDLAASSLRDLSYQTPPMIEAQAGDNRGIVLDLDTVRPVPKVSRTLARLREIAHSLPEQYDDDGVEEDLLRELAEMRPGRARANRLIGDP
jgi:uncharacterized phage-associated protein